MFIQASKLKRDYVISYQFDLPEDAFLYDKVFEFKVKDCRSFDEAYNAWNDFMEFERRDVRDWYCDAIPKTRQQMINDEVYELLLSDLFESEINVFGLLDDDDENWEINGEDLTSIEKMFISYEAQVKYNKLSGAV
jgi:hypothetical protein